MFAQDHYTIDRHPIAHLDSGCPQDPVHLKAKAERYRRLSESLLDPGIIRIVLTCASELEATADALSESH